MSDAISALFELADTARREKRLDDAHDHLREAVTLALSLDNARLEGVALAKLGQIERDRGHSGNAVFLYEEAAACFRNATDALNLASALRHIGDIHRETGDLAAAGPFYEVALKLYRAMSSAGGNAPVLALANTLRPMALRLEALGEVAEAQALWREARELYAQSNVQAGVDECDAHLNTRH